MKKPFRRIIALLLAACCLYSFSGCASVKDIISTLIKIKEKYGSEETTTFETDLPETLAEADTTASETVNPINAEEEPPPTAASHSGKYSSGRFRPLLHKLFGR